MKDNKRGNEHKYQTPSQHEQFKPQQPAQSPSHKETNFPQNWPKKKER